MSCSTRAWALRVDAAIHRQPQNDSLDGLLMANPDLLDKESLFLFYTRERLISDAARDSWVEPDRRPLS